MPGLGHLRPRKAAHDPSGGEDAKAAADRPPHHRPTFRRAKASMTADEAIAHKLLKLKGELLSNNYRAKGGFRETFEFLLAPETVSTVGNKLSSSRVCGAFLAKMLPIHPGEVIEAYFDALGGIQVTTEQAAAALTFIMRFMSPSMISDRMQEISDVLMGDAVVNSDYVWGIYASVENTQLINMLFSLLINSNKMSRSLIKAMSCLLNQNTDNVILLERSPLNVVAFCLGNLPPESLDGKCLEYCYRAVDVLSSADSKNPEIDNALSILSLKFSFPITVEGRTLIVNQEKEVELDFERLGERAAFYSLPLDSSYTAPSDADSYLVLMAKLSRLDNPVLLKEFICRDPFEYDDRIGAAMLRVASLPFDTVVEDIIRFLFEHRTSSWSYNYNLLVIIKEQHLESSFIDVITEWIYHPKESLSTAAMELLPRTQFAYHSLFNRADVFTPSSMQLALYTAADYPPLTEVVKEQELTPDALRYLSTLQQPIADASTIDYALSHYTDSAPIFDIVSDNGVSLSKIAADTYSCVLYLTSLAANYIQKTYPALTDCILLFPAIILEYYATNWHHLSSGIKNEILMLLVSKVPFISSINAIASLCTLIINTVTPSNRELFQSTIDHCISSIREIIIETKLSENTAAVFTRFYSFFSSSALHIRAHPSQFSRSTFQLEIQVDHPITIPTMHISTAMPSLPTPFAFDLSKHPSRTDLLSMLPLIPSHTPRGFFQYLLTAIERTNSTLKTCIIFRIILQLSPLSKDDFSSLLASIDPTKLYPSDVFLFCLQHLELIDRRNIIQLFGTMPTDPYRSSILSILLDDFSDFNRHLFVGIPSYLHISIRAHQATSRTLPSDLVETMLCNTDLFFIPSYIQFLLQSAKHSSHHNIIVGHYLNATLDIPPSLLPTLCLHTDHLKPRISHFLRTPSLLLYGIRSLSSLCQSFPSNKSGYLHEAITEWLSTTYDCYSMATCIAEWLTVLPDLLPFEFLATLYCIQFYKRIPRFSIFLHFLPRFSSDTPLLQDLLSYISDSTERHAIEQILRKQA